jgi:hypothetical protein
MAIDFITAILIFIIFIICIAIILAARSNIHRRNMAEETYYYGTADDVNTLPPGAIITNDLSDAIMHIGKWTNDDIKYEIGARSATEMYPGAFDKLRAAGYVYYVAPINMSSAQVCRSAINGPMPIIKRDYIVEAFEKMKILGKIRFIKYNNS